MQSLKSNTVLGKIAEDHACSFLQNSGYRILERNWRYSHAEIDIIASKDGELVFIEVKSRSSLYFGEPSEFVSPSKELRIKAAAQRYMEQISYSWAIRFDIISIFLDVLKRPIKLMHYEDAFF